MAKEEIVKFKGICKFDSKHENEYDTCPNCRKQNKLHLITNEDGKITKVSCKNCHHSYDRIPCKHCGTIIYWQNFTTKGILEAQKKKKQKQEDKSFWENVALVMLAILVAWLYVMIL